jgi:hypothetical protein
VAADGLFDRGVRMPVPGAAIAGVGQGGQVSGGGPVQGGQGVYAGGSDAVHTTVLLFVLPGA